MYKEHDACTPPEDENINIWRYMDFTKFISLLDSSSLYFTRSDKFEDPFEGSVPNQHLTFRKEQATAQPDLTSSDIGPNLLIQSGLTKNALPQMMINCWHMNKHESAAMWKLYLKSNEGIAIQSTYSRLKENLISAKNFHLGCVKYIDYESESFKDAPNDFITPYFHKRMSYKHEDELRALVWVPENGPFYKPNNPGDHEEIEHGIKIQIRLNLLIENIYLPPASPPWFMDLVQSVVSKYGHDFKVLQSQLDKDYFY